MQNHTKVPADSEGAGLSSYLALAAATGCSMRNRQVQRRTGSFRLNQKDEMNTVCLHVCELQQTGFCLDAATHRFGETPAGQAEVGRARAQSTSALQLL